MQMEKSERPMARQHLVAAMLAGQSWQEIARALNRDVMILCTKVAQDQPHLPDGRRLIFRLQGTHILPLDAQEKKVA